MSESLIERAASLLSAAQPQEYISNPVKSKIARKPGFMAGVNIKRGPGYPVFVSGEVFSTEAAAREFGEKWIELKLNLIQDPQKTRVMRALGKKLGANGVSTGY
jgi:hypothetical protein